MKNYRSSGTVLINPNSADHIPRSRETAKTLPGPIQWTLTNEMEILSINREEYPYRKYLEAGITQLQVEKNRFRLALDGYLESRNPVMPVNYIIRLASQTDGATILKRIRMKSFLKTQRDSYFYEEPEWWNSTPHFLIKDIGDIFNYQYLIFWKEEVNDMKDWSFVPLKQDKEILDKFRQATREVLSDDRIEIIDPREILMDLSGSNSYLRGEKMPHYSAKEISNNFAPRIGRCYHGNAMKSPGDTRDIITLEPAALNSVKLIDRQVFNIVSQWEESLMKRDPDAIERKVKEFSNNWTFYCMRDMKKEGLTKPRNLCTIMLHCLAEKYPEVETFELLKDFYEDYSVMFGDEEVFPLRGHGLGMANSLTTLMQFVIWHMAMTMADSGGLTINEPASFLCLNDDFVAGFDSLEEMEIWYDIDRVILEGLGIIRAENKSFWMPYGGVSLKGTGASLHIRNLI